MRTKTQWRNYAAQCLWTAKRGKSNYKKSALAYYSNTGNTQAAIEMMTDHTVWVQFTARARAYKEFAAEVGS